MSQTDTWQRVRDMWVQKTSISAGLRVTRCLWYIAGFHTKEWE